MGLDTYCCLIFYGLTLIHLTGPLSQVVQLKCVMCNIYIYIERERDVFAFLVSILSSLFEELSRQTHSHTPLWTEFWEKREELINRSFSDHHAPEKQIIGYQRRAEMTSQSTNQGNGLNFAVKCMLTYQHVSLCNLNSHHMVHSMPTESVVVIQSPNNKYLFQLPTVS